MKIILLIALISIISCKEKEKQTDTRKSQSATITTKNYELIKSKNPKALLIIFPGGGTTSKETKENFNIVESATSNNISVLFMNFNRHLWIDKEETEDLSIEIEEIIKTNKLKTDNIFTGGMSIGGTVAITVSNYLSKINSPIKPKGVFVIDSPIDLFALYESSKRDVKRKGFSDERLEEPKFIVDYFEDAFGGKDSLLSNIQKVSPVTLKTKNTENIKDLKNTKLRFYTEPDTLWWKDNRQTDFESTNAYTLQKTSRNLKNKNWSNFQLIQTKNKGYRMDGERHPHSWSIVDINELIVWILEEK
jgi:hypothetical protein